MSHRLSHRMSHRLSHQLSHHTGGLATLAVMALALALPAFAHGERKVHYDWLTQGEVSGRLELTLHEDGSRSAWFEYNDRGRGPALAERYRVDDAGLIESFSVSGKPYMGAPVDERFEYRDGAARWHSTVEHVELAGELTAFYVASEGTPEQLAALARALLRAPGGVLPLWPSGEARLVRLAEEELVEGAARRRVTLYSIAGLDFGPSHVWLDESDELFGLAGGLMGLVPRGWQVSWERLDRRQREVQRESQQALAAALTQVMPAASCLVDFAVLDIDAGRTIPGSTLRLERGRITAVGADGEIDCRGVPVLRGEGRTLMPGLWDMHVHMNAGAGPLHVAAGVTTVRDLGNDHERLLELIGQIERGETIGPRVRRAGVIDGRSPYSAPTTNLASDLDEALALIAQVDAQGYRQVKIYSSIPPEWVEPLAAEARRRGITVSGHVPSGMNVTAAVRAGFDEIQHVNMLFLNFLAGPEDDTRTPLRFTRVAERAAGLDLDSDEVAGFIELLQTRRIVVDPTVAIFDSMFRHRTGELDPSYAMIAAHLPPNRRRAMLTGRLDVNDDNAARYASAAEALLAMIGRLHAAGVPLVAGSDSLAGFTLHRELELYSQAGIPPAEVLRIATLGAARVAGVDDRSGRIAPGYDADLVMLDGDPLEDLGALRRVALTVIGERAYTPAVIYPALGIRPFVEGLEWLEE